MAAHLQELPTGAEEVDMVISVLGLMKADETLWALAQKYLKKDVEELFDISWQTLGISAVRTGHLKQAKILLEKVEDVYDFEESLVIKVRKALKEGKPLASLPQYPTLGLLLPPVVINELIVMLGQHLENNHLPRHIQKKLG